MAFDRVKKYFDSVGMGDKVMQFDVSSATVAEAAAAIGCQPCRIAKTLSFRAGDDVVLIVAAGDVKIDNVKYKAQFKTKAKMLTYAEAEECIGHAVGGVCPFAVNDGVKVYLDASLRRFDTVYPACGSSSSAIELTVPQLELHSCSLGWVDVCKLI